MRKVGWLDLTSPFSTNYACESTADYVKVKQWPMSVHTITFLHATSTTLQAKMYLLFTSAAISPNYSIGTFCRELYRSGWTDRFAVWVVDSGGPKEAQVQSYLSGGADVLTREGLLAPPGEYDSTVSLRRRCGLMSNYFDHLFTIFIRNDLSVDFKRFPTTSWLCHNFTLFTCAYFKLLSVNRN